MSNLAPVSQTFITTFAGWKTCLQDVVAMVSVFNKVKSKCQNVIQPVKFAILKTYIGQVKHV